jgi:hypothetical protein
MGRHKARALHVGAGRPEIEPRTPNFHAPVIGGEVVGRETGDSGLCGRDKGARWEMYPTG